MQRISRWTFAALLMAAAVFLPLSLFAQSTLPTVGQTAPAFTLPSQDDTPITLESFRGQWVVVYFYPRDMTSGCTIEAHNFQRDLKLFEARHAVILGISVDSTDSHKQFCTKESLDFRLLADTSHSVTNAYGSLAEYNGVTIAARNTFLVDPEGKIAQVWTKVKPATASSDVLAALPSAK